jgi:repressor LexA
MMKVDVAFNINNYVRVRLTDVGRAELERQHGAFWSRTVRRTNPPTYEPPAEDDGGWSKWTAWDLFGQLGHLLFNGGDVPFEMEIHILGCSPLPLPKESQ